MIQVADDVAGSLEFRAVDLWSADLFPTLARSTAQGVTFACVRIGLGLWSFFVPLLTSTGFATLAWILTAFLVASALVGLIWAPRNEGKSLELELERGEQTATTSRTHEHAMHVSATQNE